MPVSHVPYTVPEEAAPRILSKEEREALTEKRKSELAQLQDGTAKAKFKIEVLFNKDFSCLKPSAGIISFWESGSQLHGGGDAIIHFCPGKKLRMSNCTGYIPDTSHGYGLLVCPSCQTTWKGEQVDGQFAARLSTIQWADVILHYFRKLHMSCDLVIKHHKVDLRKAAQGTRAEDTLYNARLDTKRVKRIYTLSAIIADTSAGADLHGRILAFIRA